MGGAIGGMSWFTDNILGLDPPPDAPRATALKTSKDMKKIKADAYRNEVNNGMLTQITNSGGLGGITSDPNAKTKKKSLLGG